MEDVQFELPGEVPVWRLRYAMLSTSISKVIVRLKPRFTLVNIPATEIAVPVIGIGFLFFHFFDSESKKHEIGQLWMV